MSSLLESIAVARRYEEEAAEILGAYINTQPQMAYNYSAEAAPVAAAPAPGAPGGGGGARKGGGQASSGGAAEAGEGKEEEGKE
jgi:hypothetical protein